MCKLAAGPIVPAAAAVGPARSWHDTMTPCMQREGTVLILWGLWNLNFDKIALPAERERKIPCPWQVRV